MNLGPGPFSENSSETNQAQLCSAPFYPRDFSDKTLNLVLSTFLHTFQMASKMWALCGFVFCLYLEAGCTIKKLREFSVVVVGPGVAGSPLPTQRPQGSVEEAVSCGSPSHAGHWSHSIRLCPPTPAQRWPGSRALAPCFTRGTSSTSSRSAQRQVMLHRGQNSALAKSQGRGSNWAILLVLPWRLRRTQRGGGWGRKQGPKNRAVWTSFLI